MKKNIVFVITSKTNMGDLALCLNWVKDLGREQYHFGFVCDADFLPYLDAADTHFVFAKEQNVKDTILAAVQSFSAHALIFATNAFWNLPGYEGHSFGRFILDPGDVSIPVLSFDPFEIGFDHIMPQSGAVIPFSAVPSWVYALRYMSVTPLSDNARHFYSESIYNKATLTGRESIIAKWNGLAGKRTIFYPLSKDRFNFIQEHYPGYFSYLAGIFSELSADGVQVFTIMPAQVPELAALPNVIILPSIPYHDFLSLIHAADLYLTDSFVSCIVEAIQLETPSLLLINSEESSSLSADSFLGQQFFPFRVWPYGMEQVSIQLETLFEIAPCYAKAEILDKAQVLASMRQLLFSATERERLAEHCRAWKAGRKNRLPAPHKVLADLLN